MSYLSAITPTARFNARAACMLALGALLAACGSSDGAQSGPPSTPPTPVHVKNVQPQPVDVYADYPGRIQGLRTVQVIGRVNGILLKKHYNEGQIVHAGQLLYTIDPKPFQATVDQRKATLQMDKANLANTRRVWKRTSKLYQANAVSKAERDQALANYQSDQASVQLAEANLESAQIDLEYTHVTAPITGVTSLREVDEGGLIKANQTQLTSITQLNPVYALFALPEDDAIARKKALSEMGNKTTNAATREATIILPDGSTYPKKGEVDFTQSTIDPQTGTVQLRAVVKNPDNSLMPGRYVRVRIRIETLPKAILIPDAAVSSSNQQTQVYVVVNGKAKPVTVQLGPSVATGRVISKGLSPGDRVITSGLGQVKPGAQVNVLQSNNANGGASASKTSSAVDGNGIQDVARVDGPRRLRLSGPLALATDNQRANR